MAGPSVSTGSNSKQDYGTPWNFIRGPVAKRFGEIQFDLAAHGGNAKHNRYFAPRIFTSKGTLVELEETPLPPSAVEVTLAEVGANKKKQAVYLRTALNNDPNAYAYDSLAQDWAALSAKFKTKDGPGLLWLNCEFDDIGKWSKKCLEESKRGANVLLLVPVSISNWWRDYVAGRADTYFMVGRLSFDGKNPYPKDLMSCHFCQRDGGRVHLWQHSTDTIVNSWALEQKQ